MIRWIAVWISLAALSARSESPGENLMAAGVARFNAAYRAWDGSGFTGAADLFRQASKQAPASFTNFYWLGVAEFHRLLQIRSLPPSRTNELAADAVMDAALTALNTAVKLDDRDAESHALLGTLYGMKIDGNLARAVRFGPRVAKHQKPALAFGAENPRVRYLLGTCQFHTATKPAAWREALATLLAAEKLFAAEAQRPAGPLAPRWGRASCLMFIAQTYERLGQPAEAVDYYRQALVEQPSNHLARERWNRLTVPK